MNDSCHTKEWVLSHQHKCNSYVTHMNEWVMSHKRTQLVATRYMESCHTCEYVLTRIRISHVTSVTNSCHTHEWVVSHTHKCNSHVTRMNAWVMSYNHTYNRSQQSPLSPGRPVNIHIYGSRNYSPFRFQVHWIANLCNEKWVLS